jgi:transcription initiation factor IIF auxiliary subunit
MSDLIVTSYSRFERQRNGLDIFPFCAFVDPASRAFKELSSVEYVLHPSFPDPTRRSSDSRICFAIESEAWGGFGISIRGFMRSGEILRATYDLRLERDAWPKGDRPTAFASTEASAVYGALFDERYDWRKLSTIVRRSGIAEDRVLEVLAHLATQRVVRKAYFLSIDKEELWGATAVVGLMPSSETTA